MRSKVITGILLFVFIAGAMFIFFPRSIQVSNAPCEIIYHGLKEKSVVRIRLTERDDISEEIWRFFTKNRTGWHIIIRQFSLGETAPSIEIFGENESYSLGVWKDEVVLGFIRTGKSYRKKIDPDFHAKLVTLIIKNLQGIKDGESYIKEKEGDPRIMTK